MGCLWSGFRRVIVGLCSLLKVGIAIAIIIIVALHLTDVTVRVNQDGQVVDSKATCLMTGNVRGATVCEYAYAVCGVSLVTSLVLFLFLCITCDACGFGAWIEFIVGGLLTAWWVIAGIVFTAKFHETEEQRPPIPGTDWRIAVFVMAWVAAGLAAISTLVYLVEALKCLCSCCEDDHDDRRYRSNVV